MRLKIDLAFLLSGWLIMSEFNDQYLKLLRTQVDEEINYLLKNKHHNKKLILEPCMFCVQCDSLRYRKYYSCRRMEDLKRFQASIISHNPNEIKIKNIPAERRKIGHLKNENSGDAQIFPALTNFSDNKLPLISVKL